MNPEKDAFGKHLLAQYEALLNGDRVVAEIVERDDHYIDIGSTSMMYFSDYDEWSELEREMIDRARGRVLDVGCGAGRHSLYLQKKGFEVTGIDNSIGALGVCKRRGLKKAVHRSIEEIDQFESESFDTILMLGNNFGLFGGPEKAKRILELMHRITKPDAQIIAKTLNPYMTEDEAHLKYQKRNKKLGRMTGQIRLRIRYKKFKGEWFDYLFVSPDEMEAIVEGTEWQIAKLFNSEESDYFAVIEKTPRILKKNPVIR